MEQTFKMIIKLEKLSQILLMVWIFLAPICSFFPVWIRIWERIKTWFGNVWWNAIETQPENLMLFSSTTQSVQALSQPLFGKVRLTIFFCKVDRSQILFLKSASPECCQTFHKDDFQVSPKYTMKTFNWALFRTCQFALKQFHF